MAQLRVHRAWHRRIRQVTPQHDERFLGHQTRSHLFEHHVDDDDYDACERNHMKTRTKGLWQSLYRT